MNNLKNIKQHHYYKIKRSCNSKYTPYAGQSNSLSQNHQSRTITTDQQSVNVKVLKVVLKSFVMEKVHAIKKLI